MNRQRISQLLPHRPPMLLLDDVPDYIPGSGTIQARFTAPVEHQKPEYPIVLVLESFCQAGGLLYLLQLDHEENSRKLMIFGSLHSFSILHPVRPGERMVHTVSIDRSFQDSAIMSGTVHVDNKLVAKVDKVVIALRQPSAMTA